MPSESIPCEGETTEKGKEDNVAMPEKIKESKLQLSLEFTVFSSEDSD